MKDLSPRAQQLLKAGKNAGAPSDADKTRIREALQQRLVVPPAPTPPGAAGPSLAPATGAPWALIAGASMAVAVLAGVLMWGVSGADAPPTGALPPAPSTLAPMPLPRASRAERVSSPRPAPPSPPAPAVAKAPAASAHPPSDTRPKSRLAEEVALLSRATSALHSGRAQDALSALAEHQQKFPRGHLSVERAAARAQALCQLGRKAEAERELARLSPTSPEAARARRACGRE